MGVPHIDSQEVFNSKESNASTRGKSNSRKYSYDYLSSKQYTVEDLISMAGTSGVRNFVVITLCLAVQVILPMHLITYEFLGEYSDHRCDIPELAESNWTEEEIRNYSIPFNEDKKEYSKCLMYARDYNKVVNMNYSDVVKNPEYNKPNDTVDEIKCSDWYFMDSNIDSIVTEFNLVCDRKWLYSSTGSATMFGTMLGSLCVGYLFDTFGRSLIIILAAPTYLIIGISCAFAPNISAYIIFKTLMASVGMAFALGPLTLCFELCSPKQRGIIAGYSGILWSLGYMGVAPVTYLVRPWRYLQLALVTPILLQFPNYWFLPESPRWLITNGRYKEALKVLKLFASSNRRILPEDDEILNIMQSINAGQLDVDLKSRRSRSMSIKVKESIKSLTAIIRIKELRPRALIIFFCWFTVTMVYYGVTLTATTFSSNKYLYVFISGLLEVPSTVAIIPPLRIFGRKKTISFCYISTGVFILAALLYDRLYSDGSNVGLMAITLCGRFGISAAFAIAFIYTNELFPTQYRAIALGEASGIGRIGSSSSPYINDMLSDVSPWAPRALFAAVSSVAGILSLFLPETAGVELQDRVAD